MVSLNTLGGCAA